jgi:hypothetical protein
MEPILIACLWVSCAAVPAPQDKCAMCASGLQIACVFGASFVCSSADLEGSGPLNKMKMLQRMRMLEEKGGPFANKPIKDLQVFGEGGGPRAGGGPNERGLRV